MRSTKVITIIEVIAIVALLAFVTSSGVAQPKSEPAKDSDAEAAIQKGLKWLALKQRSDGGWGFDGSSRDRYAATGMALLPFLNAGEGPTIAAKYQDVVKKGVDWLVGSVQKDGKIATNMYSQAIGTIALCHAYHLSKDAKLLEKTKIAVNYIIAAQGRNGSWGYSPRAEGDTSILNWQIQALALAERAGIAFGDAKTFKKADEFLQSVSTDGGSKYGYREKGASQTLTPDGLMSRNLMGTLSPKDTAYARGVEFLKQFPPQKGYFDTYYYLSATRVMAVQGGDDWSKFWKPKMRDLLLEFQTKSRDDATNGCWPKDQGFIGSACGNLGTTSFAILILESICGYSPKPGEELFISSEERLKKQIEEQLKKLKK